MILNLSNFIYSLLLENETVIIPGFGAFVSTYKPAEFLENEIKPPSKEVTFTQKIKNNDGMLAEIIARKAKISQSYAMKRIEKARENMLYALDKGETVIVENIGTLVYNENNEIQFTPFQDENLLLDSFGLETISTEDLVQKAEDFENEKAQIEEVTEQTGSEDEIGETEIETVGEQIAEETQQKVEAIISPVVEIENELIQEEKTEIIQKPDFKTSGKVDIQKEKKKIGWYWYMLILIIIVISGFFIFKNKSNTSETVVEIEKSSNAQQQEIQAETVLPADSVEKSLAEPTNTESGLNDSAEPKISSETTKYYIIGGSFKNEERVEKYILKLKEKGMNGFSLGQKGKLYLVGIDSFDNETDAQKSLNELVKANPGWNLWIYKK